MFGGHQPAAPARGIPGETIVVVGLVLAAVVGLGGLAWYLSPAQACERHWESAGAYFTRIEETLTDERLPVAERRTIVQGFNASAIVELERFDAMGCVPAAARGPFDELLAEARAFAIEAAPTGPHGAPVTPTAETQSHAHGSPTPDVSPLGQRSPGAQGVVDAAMAVVRHPEFSGRLTFEVSVQHGGEVVRVVEGTTEFVGQDEHARYAIEIDGQTYNEEEISVGSDDWVRRGEEPWMVRESPEDFPIARQLASIPALENLGAEMIDGRWLWHLRPPPDGQVDPDLWSAFAQSDEARSVDLWVDEDGRPARMVATLTSTDETDGAPLKYVDTSTFDYVGIPVSIEPPPGFAAGSR